MMHKTDKFHNYCVYVIPVKTGRKMSLYVGHGDSVEPSRRKYDFLKNRRLSNKIEHNTKQCNYWDIQPVVIYKKLTKNQALLIENELIGVIYKDSRCLNTYAAVRNYGEFSDNDIQKARQAIVDLLDLAHIVKIFTNAGLNRLLSPAEINTYKTIAEIAENSI